MIVIQYVGLILGHNDVRRYAVDRTTQTSFLSQ
jgi:hypothetical protein